MRSTQPSPDLPSLHGWQKTSSVQMLDKTGAGRSDLEVPWLETALTRTTCPQSRVGHGGSYSAPTLRRAFG